jgi:hypothetical protein
VTVDRERALSQLAGVYGRALRLADDGRDEPAIAAELGVDVAAVPALLRIGGEKLHHLLAAGDDAADADDGATLTPTDPAG